MARFVIAVLGMVVGFGAGVFFTLWLVRLSTRRAGGQFGGQERNGKY